MVFHHKPYYNVMRVTITAREITTLVFVPSCYKLKNQSHFLNIFKSEVLSCGHTHSNCGLWWPNPYHSSISTKCWLWTPMRAFLSHLKIFICCQHLNTESVELRMAHSEISVWKCCAWVLYNHLNQIFAWISNHGSQIELCLINSLHFLISFSITKKKHPV